LTNAAPPGVRDPCRRVGSAFWMALACCTAAASAQSVTVSAVGDALRVRAPAFSIIKGETLSRLRNGRTVRFDLELAVLPEPGTSPAAQVVRGFVLSYDLWEERFAVTLTGTAPRSISHLRSAAADAWCIDQLAVPLSALGPLGRGAPLWIRLEYRIEDPDQRPKPDDDGGYTLRGLIDILSRRSAAGALRDAIEAGPFRMSK
jgi:hypothetical protein